MDFVKPQIKNVVTTANLGQNLDLTTFNNYFWGIYDQDVYGGRCGYVHEKGFSGKVTVFRSGKLISVGTKSVKDSIDQLENAKKHLVDEGFIKDVKIKPLVRNLVAVLNLGKKIPIEQMAPIIGGSYEPEQFPALIYRFTKNTSYLIFASGKIIINGTKSEEEVNTASFEIQKLISDYRK